MTRGPELLDQFLKSRDIKRADAAAQLRTSVSAIHYWINGGQRPRANMRKRIERWTAGEIPESVWMTDAEVAENEVEPATEGHDDAPDSEPRGEAEAAS